MSRFFNHNSKIVGIFQQDGVVPKNFAMSKKNARFNNIVMRRACGVPILILAEPFKILAGQNNMPSVKFYKQGMMISMDDHSKLLHLLINSVKYN
jgi:hypothetical protein